MDPNMHHEPPSQREAKLGSNISSLSEGTARLEMPCSTLLHWELFLPKFTALCIASGKIDARFCQQSLPSSDINSTALRSSKIFKLLKSYSEEGKITTVRFMAEPTYVLSNQMTRKLKRK